MRANVNNTDWHFVRKDGRRLLVSLSLTPFSGSGQRPGGYLLLANDISEKKKPEMELRAALQKEKDLNELKSRFVSMASHEFRTPLGAVLSSAYLVSRYKKEDQQPQREKHIQQIVSSVNTLTDILNDFLSVGKIEEGEIHPNFVIFDIKDHTDAMIREVNHLLKQYQNIRYTHTGDRTSVLLDPSMLKHVVINLLSNAIKFSTDESTIDVYTERTDDYLTLSVKDYGIGIPEEEQRSLFKIFFRSSFATNIQGTGLGLYIVKKYVEIMGGTISFKSEIGEGTEFVIKFNMTNI
jgi:signal transduction histidine kinase